jgi:hypothetical protein
MTNDITLAELDADLLPERQTMNYFSSVNVFAPTVTIAPTTVSVHQISSVTSALNLDSFNSANNLSVINL